MARRKPAKRRPSQARYDEKNPPMTFRLPIQTRDRFRAHLRVLKQSGAAWVKDNLDQDDRRAEARAEALALQRNGLGQEIDAKREHVARLNLFGANQPSYYTEGFTVNAFSFTRMAKVRIPSTYMRLFVDVPKLSKNKRRKLRRYQGIDLHAQLQAAVQDFWKS